MYNYNNCANILKKWSRKIKIHQNTQKILDRGKTMWYTLIIGKTNWLYQMVQPLYILTDYGRNIFSG